jgi:hypothetical protein
MRNFIWTLIVLSGCVSVIVMPGYARDPKVTWISPGDDCNVGQPANYDLVASQDSALIFMIAGMSRPCDSLLDCCGDSTQGLSRDSLEAFDPLNRLVWYSTKDGTVPAPNPASSREYFTFANLQPNAVYWAIIRAEDRAGLINNWSGPLRFQTEDRIRPANIVGFDIAP